MARITYTNKTTAATSPLPATQKLTSGDANEIKASVNAAYDQIEEVAAEVAAITADIATMVSIDGVGGAEIMVFTGDTDADGHLRLPDLTALTPPVTSLTLVSGVSASGSRVFVPALGSSAPGAAVVTYHNLDKTPADEGRAVTATIAVIR